MDDQAQQAFPASKIIAGIGLIISLAGATQVPYYLVANKVVQGREIKGSLTGYEYDSTVIALKADIDTGKITINQEFAIQDIVNYKCPKGFSVGEMKGGITAAQVKALLDGNCGI